MTQKKNAQQRANAGTGAQQMGREKQIVLVVDGDAASQFYTSIFLQRLDYHVFPVRTAEDALMIMELTTPLLVITEITLPKMNGIDLLKHIKQDQRTRDIPVLIYTALIGADKRDACMQAGCAGFLAHPADYNQFYEAVQKATERTPRHFVRLATSMDVVVCPPDGGERKEQVTAISEHGMFVSTKNLLPYGATAPFTLYLDRSLAWGIRIEGKILYSHPGSGTEKNPGMGVKFTQIRQEDREAIRAFISEQLMKGIAKTINTLK